MVSLFIKIAVVATVIALATTGIIVGVIVAVVQPPSENACETLRAPTDLRIVPAANFLTVSWANSTDDCADHYEVVVEMNGIVSNITTQVPHHYFEHTGYCTEVNISVTRIAEDETRSAPASITYTRRVSPGFGTVTDLTLTRIDDAKVMVRWVGPTGFDLCTIRYIVTVDGGATLVEGKELEITLENLKHCTNTTISVVPVIDGIEGTQIEEDTTLNVPNEFAAVLELNVGFRDDEDNVLVTWSRPAGFDACTITYQVTVDEELTMFDDDDELEYTVSLADMVDCEKKTIYVLPVVGPIEGISKSVDAVVQVSAGFAPVLDLAVNYLENQHALVTWRRPAGFVACTISYQVTLDNGEPTPIDDDVLEYTVSLVDLPDCGMRTIHVVPVVGPIEGVSHSVHAVQLSPGFAHVLDLTVNYHPEEPVAFATWKRPPGFDECIITYQVTVDNGIPTKTNQLQYPVLLAGLPDCATKTVHVLPLVGPIEGLFKSVDAVQLSSEFAPVLQLAINYADEEIAVITWNRPDGFIGCNILYRVTVDDGVPNVIDQPQFLVSLVQFTECESRTVHVRPVVGPIKGQSLSVNVVRVAPGVVPGFAPVLDLDVTYPHMDRAIVTWNRPAGFEQCAIEYQVTVDEGESRVINVREYEVSLAHLEECGSRTVHVLPVIGPVKGESRSMDAVRLTPGFPPVLLLNVQYLDVYNALVAWIRPAGLQQCTIQYQVTVDEGVPNVINLPQFEVSLVYFTECESRTIHVRPVVGPIKGQSLSVNVVRVAPGVVPGFAPVLYLDVVYPHMDKAIVTWNRPDGFEQCTIQYQVTVDEGVPNVINLPQYEVSLVHFTECESRTVHVRPVVGPIKGQSLSVNVVRVAPGVVPGFAPVLYLDVVYPHMDKAIVTWNRPDGFEQCTIQYQVTVDEGVPNVINLPQYEVSLVHFTECESRTVHVRPVVGPIKGQSLSVNVVRVAPGVVPGFAPVLDLDVTYPHMDKPLVTWNRPAGFEQCTIEYQVTVDEGESRVINVREYEVSLAHLEECGSRTVHVLPVIGPVKGESRSVDAVRLTPGFPPVLLLNVQYLDIDNALVAWIRPAGLQQCTIQYQVTVNEGVPNVINLPQYEVSLVHFTECESRTVHVRPVVGPIKGQSLSVNVVRVAPGVVPGFAPVLDLDVTYPHMDKPLVTWNRPAGFEQCTIEYQVTVDEGESRVINVREYEVSLAHLEECGSRTVHVLPVIGPVKGESRSVDAVRLTPGFPPVLLLNVQYLDIDNALVAWIRPAGLQQCTIQYQVTVNEGVPNVINLPQYEVSLVHFTECESRTVHVRPVVGPIKGQSLSVNVVRVAPGVVPGFAPVLDLDVTYPHMDKAIVIWNRPAGFEQCTIEYQVTVDEGESRVINVRAYEVALAQLEQCGSRTVDVLPVIGPIKGTLKSVDVVAHNPETCPQNSSD